MTEAAPFWSVASLVADSADPLEFQVSLEDIVSGTGRLIEGELSRYSAKGTPFSKGDILFGKLRPYLAKYWLADREGTAGGDIHVYRPEENIDPRYLAYIVGSRNFIRFAEAASKGVKMPRVEWMSLREYSVAKFGLDAQRTIADYLDSETAEIDAMIAKMDELAEALNARRIRSIDSVLSTFDHIPLEAGWNVTDCLHKTAKFIESGENFVVSIGQLDSFEVDPSTALLTTDEAFSELRAGGRAPAPGDAVMSRNASVGKLAVVSPRTPPFALGQDVVLLSPRSAESASLLSYAMSSTANCMAIELAMLGTTFKRINVAAIKKLPWPNVALEEQDAILNDLNDATGKIDVMLAKVAELKSLLIERRAALITEVVTGRKEVA